MYSASVQLHIYIYIYSAGLKLTMGRLVSKRRCIYLSLLLKSQMIYIGLAFYCAQVGPGKITIKHTMSCEKDPAKRKILLRDHCMEHLFRDVRDIQNGEGFCFVCGKVHPCNARAFKIDIFLAGTSCKDLSMLNSKRKDFAGAYVGAGDSMTDAGEVKADEGTSGVTYKYGFKKARLLKELYNLVF